MSLARSLPVPDSDLIYFLENDYPHQHGWVSKVLELVQTAHTSSTSCLCNDHKTNTSRRCTTTSKSAAAVSIASLGGLRLQLRLLHRQQRRNSSVISTSGPVARPTTTSFTQLTQKRGRVLLTPIPGLSTHSMEGYLSPNVDWAALSV